MAMPEYTLRQLLEAGVHFGHHTRRWNPAMGPYLYGVRNQVHIIDLQQTVPMLDRALRAVRDVTAAGGRESSRLPSLSTTAIWLPGSGRTPIGSAGDGGWTLAMLYYRPLLFNGHHSGRIA